MDDASQEVHPLRFLSINARAPSEAVCQMELKGIASLRLDRMGRQDGVAVCENLLSNGIDVAQNQKFHG